jgi:hypothetical protein
MPIFNLKCVTCGRARKVLRSQGWRSTQEHVLCISGCSEPLVRDPGGTLPTTIVKEVIDTGIQVKALERFADAERMHADKTEIEDALAKGKNTGRTIR